MGKVWQSTGLISAEPVTGCNSFSKHLPSQTNPISEDKHKNVFKDFKRFSGLLLSLPLLSNDIQIHFFQEIMEGNLQTIQFHCKQNFLELPIHVTITMDMLRK